MDIKRLSDVDVRVAERVLPLRLLQLLSCPIHAFSCCRRNLRFYDTISSLGADGIVVHGPLTSSGTEVGARCGGCGGMWRGVAGKRVETPVGWAGKTETSAETEWLRCGT